MGAVEPMNMLALKTFFLSPSLIDLFTVKDKGGMCDEAKKGEEASKPKEDDDGSYKKEVALTDRVALVLLLFANIFFAFLRRHVLF